MYSRVEVLEVILRCSEALNAQLASGKRLTLSEDTYILGENSVLDSLGAITLLVSIETELGQLGTPINLIDAVTAQNHRPPFETISELAMWLAEGNV